jgi:hypothetical protein
MRRITIALLLSVLFCATAFTEESEPKPWTSKGNASLNISQSQFSNWAAGGESSFNGVSKLLYELNFADETTKWDNTFDFALGYSVIGDAKAIKTDDKIELNSLYGIKAAEKLFYSAAFSFKSQFMNGFDYKTDSTTPISGFLAPGYITLGLGIDWVPNKHLEINFAPLTGRLTMVTDQNLADAGAFGVDPATYDEMGNKTSDGSNTRFEFGAKAMIKAGFDVAKNVNFSSKLELFSDYLKDPQNIDIDLQALLTMKINDWLNANIAAHMIYDHDIMIMDKDGNFGPRTQFKEVFSLGLSYNF